MRKRFLIVAVLVLLLLLPQSMLAWGAKGHRIVGEIATHFLTSNAKTAIAEILGDKEFQTDSLYILSTWPDEVRSDSFWNPKNPSAEETALAEKNWNDRLNNKKWHFATVPDPSKDLSYLDEVPGDYWDGLMVNRIRRCRAILDGKAMNDVYADKDSDTKKVALSYLVHLIGDLHQPLHVGNGNDRGGNDVEVHWAGKKTNLHKVWDSKLIEKDGRSVNEFSEFLIKQIDENQIKSWSELDVLAWVKGSAEKRLKIYSGLNLKEPKIPPKLGDAYADENSNLLHTRLQMGGVRLAAMLNDVFK